MQTPLPLRHFEAIDGAHSALLRMGDFMTCADPRAWVRQSNKLFDLCVEAGMPFDIADHCDWAAERICASLLAA